MKMSHVLTISDSAKPAAKQKLWHAVRLSIPELVHRMATVRSIAGGCGYTLRVLNNGQHWEFKREGLLVEWWPSTGRIMVNKKGRGHLYTLNELRGSLSRAASQ